MSSPRKKTPSRPPVADPPGCAGRSAADRSAPGCVHDARGAIDAKPVEARCEYNAAVLRQGASERWRDVTMRVVMDEDDNGRERERESFPEVELLLTDEAERLALRVLAMDMAGNFSGQPPERQIARLVQSQTYVHGVDAAAPLAPMKIAWAAVRLRPDQPGVSQRTTALGSDPAVTRGLGPDRLLWFTEVREGRHSDVDPVGGRPTPRDRRYRRWQGLLEVPLARSDTAGGMDRGVIPLTTEADQTPLLEGLRRLESRPRIDEIAHGLYHPAPSQLPHWRHWRTVPGIPSSPLSQLVTDTEELATEMRRQGRLNGLQESVKTWAPRVRGFDAELKHPERAVTDHQIAVNPLEVFQVFDTGRTPAESPQPRLRPVFFQTPPTWAQVTDEASRARWTMAYAIQDQALVEMCRVAEITDTDPGTGNIRGSATIAALRESFFAGYQDSPYGRFKNPSYRFLDKPWLAGSAMTIANGADGLARCELPLDERRRLQPGLSRLSYTIASHVPDQDHTWNRGAYTQASGFNWVNVLRVQPDILATGQRTELIIEGGFIGIDGVTPEVTPTGDYIRFRTADGADLTQLASSVSSGAPPARDRIAILGQRLEATGANATLSQRLILDLAIGDKVPPALLHLDLRLGAIRYVGPSADHEPDDEDDPIRGEDGAHRMGEAVQIIKVELVTRGEDGEEVPLPDTVYNSTLIPDVTMTVKDSEVTSSGTLKFTVDMTIHDPASEVTDNAADRLSGVTVYVNGTSLDDIQRLDTYNIDQPENPWRPHPLKAKITKTYEMPISKPGTYIIKAETAANVAGEKGQAVSAVCVQYQDASIVSRGISSLLKVSVEAGTSSDVVDQWSWISGFQSFQLIETKVDSLVFKGSLDGDFELSPTAEIVLTSGVDSFEATIKAGLSSGGKWESRLTFVETGPETKLFQAALQTGGSVVSIPVDDGDPMILLKVVQEVQDIQSSPKGSFVPVLLKVSGPLLDQDNQGGIKVSTNGSQRELKPFVFSPKKYYIVRNGDDGRPVIFVITLEDAPPGWTDQKAENIGVARNGDGEWEVTIAGTSGELFKAKASLVSDAFRNQDIDDSGQVSTTVTMESMLAAFEIIFGERGITMLTAYQTDNAKNKIELGDVYGDLSIGDITSFRDHLIIEIEDDDDGMNALVAANYLFVGLSRLRTSYYGSLPSDYTNENFETIYKEAVQEAGRRSGAFLRLVTAGIQIVAEPADWVISIAEISDGNWSAAVGMLPFVPSGVGMVIKKGDDVLSSISAPVVQSVKAALGKPTRVAIMDNLRVLIDAGQIGRKEMQALIACRSVPKYSGSYCRKLLREHLGLPPSSMRTPQAHHDLPVNNQDKFLEAGLDINKAEYGRWVEGGPIGTHQSWSMAFDNEWAGFFGRFPNANAEQIISQMNSMRASGRYP
jgi:hypothetical protein